MEIENAQIKKAEIFIEDHGILTAFLTLGFSGGLQQGFGGYNLDKEMSAFVRGVLETVGVQKWDNLSGKIVRIKSEDGLIKGIGHPLDDKWFYPEDIF